MNKSVVSWALYDVANTVFNLGVVGLFLPLSINERQGTTDADLGFPIVVSMVIVLVISPFLGALTDQLKGRIRTFTLLNIIATTSILLIGFSGTIMGTLTFFSTAFVSVYLAELLYNSMLKDASTSENRGKIGGLGIGLGYVGSLVVLLVALQYSGYNSNYSFAFLGIALIYILAALPLTIFFDEKHQEDTRPQTDIVLSATWIQIKRSINHFRRSPTLLKYFIARYFYMVAVTTSSTFAVLYGLKTMSFTEREVELVLLLGTVFAIPGAMLWGYIVDKIGPAYALKWNILGWSLMLAAAFSIPTMNLSNQLWWPLSAILGLFFGGLWAADRPLLIQLSPSNLGEMFGIYGAVSRLSFLTGAFVWPLITVTMDLGQPAAVFFLLCCSLVGLAVLIVWVVSEDRLCPPSQQP
jgi:UMF1 family MFS transporter